MEKQEFMKKHGLTEMDYKNLVRYEDTRKSGVMNMFEYLAMMEVNNINGGKRLADWICSGTNYKEFKEVLKNERL